MSRFNFGGRTIPEPECVPRFAAPVASPVPWSPELIAHLILRAFKSRELNLACDMLRLYDVYQPDCAHVWKLQHCVTCGSWSSQITLAPFVSHCMCCQHQLRIIPDLHTWTLQHNLFFLCHKLTPEFKSVLHTAMTQTTPNKC